MTHGSTIPSSWARATLRDMVDSVDAGKSFTCEPRPARDGEWGVVKVSAMTWGEFRQNENKAVPAGRDINPEHEIKAGDILVSRANTEAYVGAPVLVRQCQPRLLLSDKSLRLKPAAGIDREWLLYALASPDVRRQISAKATGSKDSMRNISQQLLLDVAINVPPLAGQRRIVAALEDHLSRLDASLASLKCASKRLTLLRRSQLSSMRRIALDGGAPLAPLGDVAETTLGKMLDSKRNQGVDMPYLRNINVRWGWVDLDEVATVPLSQAEQTKYSLSSGDLLVCEGGEPGRCAIWTGTEWMAYQKALHRVRPGKEVLVEWLAIMLEEAVRNKRTDHLYTGTTIKHLPQERLRLIEFPVPSIETQHELIDQLSVVISTQQATLKAIEETIERGAFLRRALLAEAFAGRLVGQDPEDEPASELLARIKAERTSLQPTKKTRSARAPRQKQNAAPAHSSDVAAGAYQQELPL